MDGRLVSRSGAADHSAAIAALPLMSDGGSVVGLDFDASVAWPGYDWMGVAKAALESCARYLARDLGEQRVRVNLVAAGPLEDVVTSSLVSRCFDVAVSVGQRDGRWWSRAE